MMLPFLMARKAVYFDDWHVRHRKWYANWAARHKRYYINYRRKHKRGLNRLFRIIGPTRK